MEIAATTAVFATESPEKERNPAPACPIAGMLEMLTRPWTLHILWVLNQRGPLRFGALRREVSGISARLLTLRLRTLESEGFLRRTVVSGKLPEVLYSPTQRLLDMHEFMGQMDRMSARWREEATRPEAV